MSAPLATSFITAEGWKQIALLAGEAIVVAVLLAALFRARRRFGLSPLFATLGVFQYLQVMLAFSLYVEILPGVSISPGSVVLFSGSLFGLLLVFLRESPAETKTLVYGLFAANLSLSLLSLMISLHLESPLLRNPHLMPEALFRLDVKIMVIGTLVLVLDMLLMLYLYPAFERVLRSPFVCAAATLCVVLAFDSAAFMTGAFWGEPDYFSALSASIAAKMAAGLIYAAILAGYVRWVEPSAVPESFATPGQVLRMGGEGREGIQGHRRAPRDPELGIVRESFFLEVLRQVLSLGEQLDSQVTVFSFKPETVSSVEASERTDLQRYLLALLKSQLSQKAIFGLQEDGSLAVAISSTDPVEAERICRELHWALEKALARVRPTPRTEGFGLRAGFASSPDDGVSPERLLQLANERQLPGGMPVALKESLGEDRR